MHIFWHIMHNVLHIYWHILHIGMITYCAYSAYLLTYSLVICILCILCIQFYFGHILHILHILSTSLIAVSFVVYSVIAWSPIQGPSCSRTTTYIHCHCSDFCHKKLQESLMILFACHRVSSLSHPLEQQEDVPVWSWLEWHTTLVLVPCARRWLRIDMRSPRLRWETKPIRICVICIICRICRICRIWPAFLGPLYSSSTET